MECLDHYQGDYVIHVGDLFADANLSIDQAPWGRSSSPEFQQRLASKCHCLLKAQLPNWLHTRDLIGTRKNSETCAIVEPLTKKKIMRRMKKLNIDTFLWTSGCQAIWQLLVSNIYFQVENHQPQHPYHL